MKKLLMIILYLWITRLIPTIGSSHPFFSFDYLWIQKIVLAVVAILVCRKELFKSVREIKFKSLLITSLGATSLIFLFWYLLGFVFSIDFKFRPVSQIDFVYLIGAVLFTPIL